MNGELVLEVRGLVVSFPAPSDPSARARAGDGSARARALDGIDLRLHAGRTLGMVGESGSGKSLTALSILRLVPPPGSIDAGAILFEGRDLLALSEPELRAVRGARIAMIPQEPLAALDPVFPVGEQIVEVLRAHRALSSRAAREAAVGMLARVGIEEASARASSYPHELSGGMRQRVLFAIAMACSPRVLLADEPTTALDTTIQAQVLDLLSSLQTEHGTSVLFVSHDIGVVSRIADEVAVTYAGRIVEHATTADLIARPGHPYTAMLLRSRPTNGRPRARLEAIPGHAPALGELIPGCAFHPRCAFASERCTREEPLLRRLLGTRDRLVACHHAEEVSGA